MATATKGSTRKKTATKSSNGRSSAKRSNSSRASAKRTNSRSTSSRNGSAAKGRLSQLADKASKARVPLIAGGAAIASAAAGAAAHKFAESRSGSNGKLRGLTSKLSPGKLDAEKIRAAGERLSALGQQTADIAGAVEKTRKKH